MQTLKNRLLKYSTRSYLFLLDENFIDRAEYRELHVKCGEERLECNKYLRSGLRCEGEGYGPGQAASAETSSGAEAAAHPADVVGESTSGVSHDENQVQEAVLSLGGASTVQSADFHDPSAFSHEGEGDTVEERTSTPINPPRLFETIPNDSFSHCPRCKNRYAQGACPREEAPCPSDTIPNDSSAVRHARTGTPQEGIRYGKIHSTINFAVKFS
jgi:hypothetical protein